MKKIICFLLICFLFSCSSDSKEEEIPIVYYDVTLEIISSNQFNSFEYFYDIGDNKGFSLSSSEILNNQPKWTHTIRITAPPTKNILLVAWVGWKHTTTLNIYINGELKKTEDFSGDIIGQHELRYELE